MTLPTETERVKHTPEPWQAFAEASVFVLQELADKPMYRKAVILDEPHYEHARACVNALSNLNPDGVAAVVEAVEDAAERAAERGDTDSMGRYNTALSLLRGKAPKD